MPKANRPTEKAKHRALLYIATSAAEGWNDVLAPWFERVLAKMWKRQLPSLVVVPTRGQANDLKARMIANGLSHLGLQFVTPTSLRALLARDETTPPAEPEHLRLLLAIAATEMEKRPNESEALAAKAVARAPASLLRALDCLTIAGWRFEELGLSSFAPIIQRFEELVKKCDFGLSGEIDRKRLQKALSDKRRFSDVVVTGFDGEHWPDWFLLRTAVELAENATVLLEEPHGDFSDIDLSWIGSWEEICGEAQRVSKVALTSGDSLFSEVEMRGGAEPTKQYDFLVGTNFSEQADAIARQCARYLSDEKCTRLGVVFPRGGALPRLVANSLAQLEIPHNDGLGHIVPGVFETAEWQAWIKLQRAPRLDSFLNFLNELPDPAVLSPKIGRKVLEKTLRESFSELLVDDLDLLREFCGAQADDKYQAAAEALRTFPFLQSSATLEQFLEQMQTALSFFGWKQHALEMANVTRDWPQRFETTFSRSLFLRWLEETTSTFRSARLAEGDHPYARVQLLTVAQAQNQHWSHLIFAGWNEGAWPPPARAEFARREEIRAFNRSVQQLNNRAARQGSQGEGHASVRENHSLYLGPGEQRAIALRQFGSLLESANEGITLTASLVQEDAPERLWNPSECFTQLYFKQRHEPLTQITLKNLQCATTLLPKAVPKKCDVQQTLIAFNERRDASKPAGEYDFALRRDNSYRQIPTLSVTDLQRMVSSPAIVWMKRYLGVEAPDDTANAWAAASGKWVHRWLAAIGHAKDGKIFAVFPSPKLIDERVSISADERRAMLKQLCDSLGKLVPDWWDSGWLNARYLARHLGGKIAGVSDWKWIATEFAFEDNGTVRIANNVELLLRGQIDLILSRNNAASFAGQEVWIVDYKTGSTKELKTSDLHDSLVKGTTLQLGLYSLALRELGAAQVSASIISPVAKKVAPQLAVSDLDLHTNVFADLAEMQRSGVFGMKGEIRAVFGYKAAYPLATLQIDNDILEDKWALTHPALVLDKEDWETW